MKRQSQPTAVLHTNPDDQPTTNVSLNQQQSFTPTRMINQIQTTSYKQEQLIRIEIHQNKKYNAEKEKEKIREPMKKGANTTFVST